MTTPTCATCPAFLAADGFPPSGQCRIGKWDWVTESHSCMLHPERAGAMTLPPAEPKSTDTELLDALDCEVWEHGIVSLQRQVERRDLATLKIGESTADWPQELALFTVTTQHIRGLPVRELLLALLTAQQEPDHAD